MLGESCMLLAFCFGRLCSNNQTHQTLVLELQVWSQERSFGICAALCYHPEKEVRGKENETDPHFCEHQTQENIHCDSTDFHLQSGNGIKNKHRTVGVQS